MKVNLLDLNSKPHPYSIESRYFSALTYQLERQHLAEVRTETSSKAIMKRIDVRLSWTTLPLPTQPEQRALWILEPLRVVPLVRLNRYSHIFVNSRSAYLQLRKKMPNVSCLEVGVDPSLFRPENVPRDDIGGFVYIGHRIFAGRDIRIIQAAQFLGHRVRVWGLGWEGLIPAKDITPIRASPSERKILYNSGVCVIGSTENSLTMGGFIEPRFLEALACGAPIIQWKIPSFEAEHFVGLHQIDDEASISNTIQDCAKMMYPSMATREASHQAVISSHGIPRQAEDIFKTLKKIGKPIKTGYKNVFANAAATPALASGTSKSLFLSANSLSDYLSGKTDKDELKNTVLKKKIEANSLSPYIDKILDDDLNNRNAIENTLKDLSDYTNGLMQNSEYLRTQGLSIERMLDRIVSRGCDTIKVNVVDTGSIHKEHITFWKSENIINQPKVAIVVTLREVADFSRLEEALGNVSLKADVFVLTDRQDVRDLLKGHNSVCEVYLSGLFFAYPTFISSQLALESYNLLLYMNFEITEDRNTNIAWSDHNISHLLSSRGEVNTIFNTFHDIESLGIIAPVIFEGEADRFHWNDAYNLASHLTQYLKIQSLPTDDSLQFPAASSFWARPVVMEKLRELADAKNSLLLNLESELVDEAIRRLPGLVARNAGMYYVNIASADSTIYNLHKRHFFNTNQVGMYLEQEAQRAGRGNSDQLSRWIDW